jgi:hypothetical protein
MTQSPFALAGARIASMGYAVLPIMPGSKVPGVYAGDEWHLQRGWNKFCSEAPAKFQVDLWSKWPNAGVGIACGFRGVIVVDIDVDGEMKDRLLGALPQAKVAKRGRKGVSLFYRGDCEKIASRNFKIDKRGVADLLAWGKQTVVPPTVHPDTREPYVWLTESTIENTPVAELPEITIEHVAGFVAVLREFGYEEERTFDPVLSDIEISGDAATTDFFRTLNEDALNNLDVWVPTLGLDRTRREGTRWRAVASWRPSSTGRAKRNPNLSFHRSGIEDFGDGTKYTAINVVMKALGYPDKSEAAVHLGKLLGYDFEPKIVFTEEALRRSAERARAREAAAEAEAAVEAPTEAQDRPSVPAAPITLAEPARPPAEPVGRSLAIVPQDQPVLVKAPADPLEKIVLDIPGGLVAEIIEWCVNTAMFPSRALALGPALTFVGTIAGRLHTGPTDLRTNLYVLGLAPSGYGKDHARKCIFKLAQEAGLLQFIGPARFMSASAVRREIEHKPSVVAFIDELGGFMRQILDRKAGPHNAQIRQDLLDLFTASGTTFGGAAYAAERAVTLQNPCLSIYGTSTPTDFWPSMSMAGVGDGLLPRWMLLDVKAPKPKEVDPILSIHDVPRRLVEGSQAILTLSWSGNIPPSSQSTVRPRVARWAGHGKESYRHWRDYCDVEATRSPENSVFWTRTMEIALKVSHIIAISRDPEQVEVWESDFDWGAALAIHSTSSLVSETHDRLASNDRQAEYLKIKRILKDAGPSGMPPRVLQKIINGEIDKRRLDSIIEQLQEAGNVFGEVKSLNPKGGRPGYRYFFTEEDEAA